MVDLDERQAVADQAREARRRQSAAINVLTHPSSAIHDAREAMFGIQSDLLGNDPTQRGLRNAMTKNDRLRGIGVICLAVGVVVLFLDALMVE